MNQNVNETENSGSLLRRPPLRCHSTQNRVVQKSLMYTGRIFVLWGEIYVKMKYFWGSKLLCLRWVGVMTTVKGIPGCRQMTIHHPLCLKTSRTHLLLMPSYTNYKWLHLYCPTWWNSVMSTILTHHLLKMITTNNPTFLKACLLGWCLHTTPANDATTFILPFWKLAELPPCPLGRCLRTPRACVQQSW